MCSLHYQAGAPEHSCRVDLRIRQRHVEAALASLGRHQAGVLADKHDLVECRPVEGALAGRRRFCVHALLDDLLLLLGMHVVGHSDELEPPEFERPSVETIITAAELRRTAVANPAEKTSTSS